MSLTSYLDLFHKVITNHTNQSKITLPKWYQQYILQYSRYLLKIGYIDLYLDLLHKVTHDISSMYCGLISSVRRTLASNLRGPGFKSRPCTVAGPGHYNNGCLAKLKTSFELNLITEFKQGTFPFITLIENILTYVLTYF